MVNDPFYSREAVDQSTGSKERGRKMFSKGDSYGCLWIVMLWML